MVKSSTKKITLLGVLAAIAIVSLLFKTPIIPSASYLVYDPADIPIIISTLLYGPGAGFVSTVIVSFYQAFIMGGGDGPIGFTMHVIATGTLIFVAGMMYKRGDKTRKSLVTALICGELARIAVMIPLNLLLTPILFGGSAKDVLPLIIPAVIPFNAIKGCINSVVAFLLYDRLSKYMS